MLSAKIITTSEKILSLLKYFKARVIILCRVSTKAFSFYCNNSSAFSYNNAICQDNASNDAANTTPFIAWNPRLSILFIGEDKILTYKKPIYLVDHWVNFLDVPSSKHLLDYKKIHLNKNLPKTQEMFDNKYPILPL